MTWVLKHQIKTLCLFPFFLTTPRYIWIIDKQNLLYLIKQGNNHRVKSIEMWTNGWPIPSPFTICRVCFLITDELALIIIFYSPSAVYLYVVALEMKALLHFTKNRYDLAPRKTLSSEISRYIINEEVVWVAWGIWAFYFPLLLASTYRIKLLSLAPSCATTSGWGYQGEKSNGQHTSIRSTHHTQFACLPSAPCSTSISTC